MKVNQTQFKSILLTGIASFFMVYISLLNNNLLIPWSIFVGCSSYFLSLRHYQQNDTQTILIKSLLSNLIGAFIGFLCITFGGNSLLSASIVTGLFSGLIVYIGMSKFLTNSAIIFLGGAVVFGLNGNISPAIVSLIVGNLIGHITVATDNKVNNK